MIDLRTRLHQCDIVQDELVEQNKQQQVMADSDALLARSSFLFMCLLACFVSAAPTWAVGLILVFLPSGRRLGLLTIRRHAYSDPTRTSNC